MFLGFGSVLAGGFPRMAWSLASADAGGMRAIARPSGAQFAWQDLELGMFVHLGPQTWQGTQVDNGTTPVSAINPKDLNTDQWAQTAVSLGARYIVFVAKHEGGFCMWPTTTTDYCIRNSPWRNGQGDVLGDIAESCRRFGLKLGVYVSPRDNHHGAGVGGVCKTPAEQAAYDAIYREQLTEVFSRYGPLVEIWFDGSTVIPVDDLLRWYQPQAMVFQGPDATIRWVGNENGFAPYPCWNGIRAAEAKTGTATALDGDPNGSVWMPNEADVSIRRPDWFWNPHNAGKVLTQDQLLSVYYRSVGRGAQMLLNIPANTDGLLPDPDVKAAAAFGQEIRRRFSHPVAATSGTGEQVMLTLPQPTKIDTVILQEDTYQGERIREYRLEGQTGGTWRTLGTGTAIGHKRIQYVGPVTVEAVRLVATKYAATPAIRSFAVFRTDAPPPTDWDKPAEAWAPNLVGSWQNSHFSLDLTKQITAADQYQLRFIPLGGAVTGLHDIALRLNGVASPAYVSYSSAQPGQLLLDMTSVGVTVQLTGTVDGAARGQIILQKLG
jgi:alpha-L-fucosidase